MKNKTPQNNNHFKAGCPKTPSVFYWSNKHIPAPNSNIGWANDAVYQLVRILKQTEQCFDSTTEPVFTPFRKINLL